VGSWHLRRREQSSPAISARTCSSPPRPGTTLRSSSVRPRKQHAWKAPKNAASVGSTSPGHSRKREEKVSVLTGLETWFALPRSHGTAATRYETLVTWMASSTLISVFSRSGPQPTPFLLRSLVLTDHGYADDLCGDAPDDTIVLLLALSGSRVKSADPRSANTSPRNRRDTASRVSWR